MPKHYAQGVNSQSGSVTFNSTKTMSVTFPVAFSVKPSLMLSLGDQSASHVYKTNVSHTSFKIKFKSPYTGEVSWRASE